MSAPKVSIVLFWGKHTFVCSDTYVPNRNLIIHRDMGFPIFFEQIWDFQSHDKNDTSRSKKQEIYQQTLKIRELHLILINFLLLHLSSLKHHRVVDLTIQKLKNLKHLNST